MRLATLRLAFRISTLHNGPPPIFWGAPGMGKTRFTEGEVHEMDRIVRERNIAKGMHILTLISSIREPADFNGLPIVKHIDGKRPTVVMAPAQWAQQAADWSEDGYMVIVFLDELSNAPPAVQAASLRGVQDGIWGDIQLPKRRVRYAAAANPPDEAASGWELSAPMANRFMHFTWPNGIEIAPDWVDGMTSGWPGEGEVTQTQRQSRIHIAAFIHQRPQLLHVLPKEEAARGQAWPSPRTWTESADLLAAARAEGVDDNVENIIIGGCIGEGTGLEFLGWERALDLPTPEAILKDPDNWKWPERGDQQFAVLASVSAYIIPRLTGKELKKDRDLWDRGWRAFSYAAEKGAKDVAAIAVRNLASSKTDDLPVPTAQLKKFGDLMRAAGFK